MSSVRKPPQCRPAVIFGNKFSKYPYFYLPSATNDYHGDNRPGAPLLPLDLHTLIQV
ncbi:hypothetical protein AArcCO_1153 [Halalkaliarchaeum sp. AArc-CO]|nr:hypothetical protein AArcCO_1153 [Halalkaliarchaeum sp. AArc-CO]